jgi:hypothetical protein
LISILVVAGLFIGLGVFVHLIFPPGVVVRAPTPEMNVIPAPSATSNAESTGMTKTPSPGNFVEINGITVGVYVQVTGTGGTGLRLRSDPGSSAHTEAVATDNEVFLVVSGPQELDGHIWWKLEAPYESSRNGWAAADFLSPIITPTPD